jgi:hypothetical protein
MLQEMRQKGMYGDFNLLLTLRISGKKVGRRWEEVRSFCAVLGSSARPERIREEAKLPTYPLIINKNTSDCAGSPAGKKIVQF